MPALPPRPAVLTHPDGSPLDGLWNGDLDVDLVAIRPRSGRLRRWSYTAAGDASVMVGAAVVDTGVAAVAFAWCFDGQTVHTWDRKGLPGRHGVVGRDARTAASFAKGRDRVTVGADGDLDLDVALPDGRLTARVEVTPDQPAVLVTPTARGGWNATRKAAGERARGTVTVAGRTIDLAGGSWRDWTIGRQDRRTVWRWAAGAGVAGDGRRVGLNVSTGMNDIAAGENVVWWDGVPHALELSDLQPIGADAAADWYLSGPDWRLDFAAAGVRAANENLLVIRSRYVQPVGTFTGSLPDPDGRPVPVELRGVTEDHVAVW
jgi:hypothetical protein